MNAVKGDEGLLGSEEGMVGSEEVDDEDILAGLLQQCEDVHKIHKKSQRMFSWGLEKCLRVRETRSSQWT